MGFVTTSILFGLLLVISAACVLTTYKAFWVSKIWSEAIASVGGHGWSGRNEMTLMKKLMADKAYVKVETGNGIAFPGFITEVTDNYFEIRSLTSFRPPHAPEIDEGEEDEHDESIFASYRISYDMIANIETDYEIHAGEKKGLIDFYRNNVIK